MNHQYTTKAWRTKADALNFETRLFIDGKFVDALEGKRFTSLNPVTGEVLAEYSAATSGDVDLAVSAARKAFRSGIWSRMAPRDRMSIMRHFADLIEAHAEEFALLDCLDMGKPVMDMMTTDVPLSVTTFRFFAETVDKIEGAVTNTASNYLHYILRQPMGVVGLIVPWNYPLMMAAWKLAPALSTGNSVVLKPAEQSPSSALLLARLFSEAGGPDGVLNVVNGFGPDCGKPLALHMDVDKIGFTGSGEVGKLMMVYSGQSNLKRVTTECGGKSPQIILQDCPDLQRAADAAVAGIYSNMGEVCSAGSRLLVQRSIYDDFLERFKETARKTTRVGDPLDVETTVGPLVSAEQQNRVLGYIDAGKSEGATLSFGGAVPEGYGHGYYVEPTLFTGVDNKMRIAQEEIFGPVASLIPVDDVDHALDLANDSIYGLAASIWTSDLNTAHRFARDMEAGMIWVNTYEDGDSTTPWGGFKESGNGRDKCLEALTQYTQTKSVLLKLA